MDFQTQFSFRSLTHSQIFVFFALHFDFTSTAPIVQRNLRLLFTGSKTQLRIYLDFFSLVFLLFSSLFEWVSEWMARRRRSKGSTMNSDLERIFIRDSRQITWKSLEWISEKPQKTTSRHWRTTIFPFCVFIRSPQCAFEAKRDREKFEREKPVGSMRWAQSSSNTLRGIPDEWKIPKSVLFAFWLRNRIEFEIWSGIGKC
jgi:hypothetical protein